MSVLFKNPTAVLCWLLCLFFLPAAASAHKPDTSTGDLRGIEEFTRKVMEEWKVPGLALVVIEGNKTLVSHGFGVRETGKADRVDANTMFAIGSASKAFTTTALGMLEDEDRLSLSQPVHTFFPSFRVRDPWVSRHVTLTDSSVTAPGSKGGISSGYGRKMY